MTSEAAIRTESLTKYYGQARGLESLDLEVARGEIFGFLGPNGAGKTTTMRLLLDLIRPSGGRAEVLGRDTRTDPIEIRRRVGYLPGEFSLYENLTGEELLRYFGRLKGHEDLSVARSFAQRLDCDLSRPIGQLSKGNKQKVGLAQAFMHEPELLILDEPTSGLDPLVQHELQAIFSEATAAGRTVFLSSHVLSEIEEVAGRVGIIRQGRLVVVEELAALKEKALRRISVVFAQDQDPGILQGIEGVREVSVEGRQGHLVVDGSVDGLLKALARYEVLDLVSSAPDLEEIFLTYYEAPDES